MDMVKMLTLAIVAASAAPAADFSIQLGNPSAAVVSNGFIKTKGSLMAVRAQDCADPAKARFTGTAVRMNGASREAAALAFVEGTTPGSFAVIGGFPSADGREWLAVITGDCLGAKAGALVPVKQGSYVREASRFFDHAPTDAEVDAVLKTITGGSR